MEIKIIHICEDEKFINSAITQFEGCFPEKNIFYVLQLPKTKELAHVKNQKCIQICNSQDLLTIAKNIENKVLVVLHSLSPCFYAFVLALPKENSIVWLCFGFEVYNDVTYFKSKNLLDRHTFAKFPDYQITFNKKLKDRLRPYYRLVKKALPLSPIEYKNRVMQRIYFHSYAGNQSAYHLGCVGPYDMGP